MTLENELLFYTQFLYDPERLIHYIAWAITEEGTTHKHQRRLKKTVKALLKQTLIEKYQDIKSFKTFDEYMELFLSIDGVGQLTAFDLSKRHGLCFGIKPEKIYLHRGAYKGARNLLGDKTKGKKFVYINDLPKEIQILSPVDIENFLCIYKDYFNQPQKLLFIKKCGLRKIKPRARVY
jgi:hypothetical protein